MGYFSQLDLDRQYEPDRSVPSPEETLRWRVADLQDRLEELGFSPGAPPAALPSDSWSRCGVGLSWVTPVDLTNPKDLLAALAQAVLELDGQSNEPTPEEEALLSQVLPGQLAVWDELRNDVALPAA